MKIAFAVHGACPSAVEELAAAVVRTRHEVQLFADHPFTSTNRRPDGVMRSLLAPARGVPPVTAARMLGEEMGARLRDDPPDLVHAFGVVAGISAHVAVSDRVPVVQTVGNLALTERRLGSTAPMLSSRMVLERRLLERASMVIASGPDQAREILRSGLAPERVVAVSPGVDAHRFPVTPLPRRTAQRPWRLLHPGGTRDHSGIQEVITAVSPLRNVHLTVLDADPADAEVVRTQARRWQVANRLTLHPRVPASVMPAMYVAADAVVIAPRQLASGRVALEALASGRPVIVTSCGSLLDVVEDGVTGFIAPPRDPSGLAEALRRAMVAPRARLESMTQRAVARVRAEHGWQQRLPSLVPVYESVVELAASADRRERELRALVDA